MKGDFSRSATAAAGYSRLLSQQGRLHTDADLNTQSESLAEAARAALRDLLGPAGGPADAGFRLHGHAGFRFDGTNELRLERPEPARLRGSGYTLEGWFRPDRAGHAAQLARCVEGDDASSGGFELEMNAQHHLSFSLGRRLPRREETDDDEPEAEVLRITDFARLATETFTHIAAVVRDGRVDLFVEGRLTAQEELDQGLPFDAGVAHLGAGFHGVIDGLQLWRVALRADVIAACAAGLQLRRLADLAPEWTIGDPHVPHHERSRRRKPRAEMTPPEPAEPELTIAAGRYYIDGLVSALGEETVFAEQSGPHSFLLPPASLRARDPGPYSAYLEAREVVTTAAEDEGLMDPAFGPADTVIGVKTVSRVRLALGAVDPAARWSGGARVGLRVAQTPGADLGEPGLLRIEIHDAGYIALADKIARPETEGFALHALHRDGRLVLADGAFGEERLWRVGRPVELAAAGELVVGAVRAVSVDDDGRTQLHVSHEGAAWPSGPATPWRLRPLATVKWSRDNAAFVARVASIDEAAPAIELDGGDGRRDALAPGDILELSDAVLTSRDVPAPLLTVAQVDSDDADPVLRITLAEAPVDPQQRPKADRWLHLPLVRRWDGLTNTGLGAGLALARDTPVRLGREIDATFSAGWCDAGEAWNAPLRDTLEWPSDARGEPLTLPSQHGRLRSAELAHLRFARGELWIEDRRRLFAPLARAARTDLVVLKEADDEIAAVIAVEPEVGGSVEIVIEPPVQPVWPQDAVIFTAHARPEPGWRSTGVRLAVPRVEPHWTAREIDAPGERLGAVAALGDTLACVLESGELRMLDPSSFAWDSRAPMQLQGFTAASVAVLDGRLHVLGYEGVYNRSWHLAYDPAEDAWVERQPPAVARRRFAVAETRGRLYAAGGYLPQSHDLSDAFEAYDPTADSWSRLAATPAPFAEGALATSEGRLHLIGGRVRQNLSRTPSTTRRIAIYSPTLNQWSDGPRMHAARADPAVIASHGRLHILGGVDGHAPPTAECLAPTSLAWIEAPQPGAAASMAAAYLGGVAYLFGAEPGSGSVTRLQTCVMDDVVHQQKKTPDNSSRLLSAF